MKTLLAAVLLLGPALASAQVQTQPPPPAPQYLPPGVTQDSAPPPQDTPPRTGVPGAAADLFGSAGPVLRARPRRAAGDRCRPVGAGTVGLHEPVRMGVDALWGRVHVSPRR